MSHPSAVLELNGPQVLRVMKCPQVPLVQEAVQVVTTQLGRRTSRKRVGKSRISRDIAQALST